ncbi:hypothetical protein CRYUN_Cryun05aG0207100 [Craigia yunnanensis]
MSNYKDSKKIMEEKSSDRIPLINPSPSIASGNCIQTSNSREHHSFNSWNRRFLGLPFAFRVASWLAGSLGVIIVGLATLYCMLLLVTGALEDRAVSQCGGSVAYLVFIGQNLASVFRGHSLTIASYIFLLVPIETALSWIGSLSAFAPFSIVADICNVLAIGFVVKEDIQQAIGGDFSFRGRKAITDNLGWLPFAGGMAVFCFEGFGMTLALEASMKERRAFPKVLAMAFIWITLVYVLFGIFGYMAHGDETKDIITLNLPKNWTAIAVQIALCLGLVFTFPIMVHPVNEILEGKLKKNRWFQKLYDNDAESSITRLGKLGIYISRAVLVIGLAVLASYVPGFGEFASLVGSTVCALISFVLPASFHLTLLGSSFSFWQKALDIFILLCGLLFAAYGTYNTIVGV